MKNCIFCKIINNEISSKVVYEDDLVKAFLDVNPVTKHHTLIVPKKHYDNIYDIPELELKQIIVVAKKLALKYKKELNIDSINLLNANGKNAQQSIFHFHMHLIPRKENDGLNLWFKNNIN